jgi:hypothetical protein
VFELLPLAVTALLPVVFLPVMGIVGTEEICQLYMKVLRCSGQLADLQRAVQNTAHVQNTAEVQNTAQNII